MIDDNDMGTPEEAAESYELFRSSQRLPSAAAPEDEAALGIAIEISDAQRSAFLAENRETWMGTEFPAELREAVLNDLAHTMDIATGLHLAWQHESEPADLLTSARSLRDAAATLATTIERLWPDRPPIDY